MADFLRDFREKTRSRKTLFTFLKISRMRRLILANTTLKGAVYLKDTNYFLNFWSLLNCKLQFVTCQ